MEEKDNKATPLQSPFLALLVKHGKLFHRVNASLSLCGVEVIREDTSRSFLFVKYFKIPGRQDIT